MIARLLEYRAAFLTLGLVAAAVGVAQVADRFVPSGIVPREPVVFTLMPQGDDVARLAPITVTFASPPAEREGPNLLRLEPAARGSYAWLSPRTLLFQPDFPGLLRGSTYSVHVPARPDAGLPEAITKKFTVTGLLAVQQIIPSSGDTEVPLGAPILVQFSRSVAPLTTLAAQPTGSVLTFDPPLAGKGEWLNTSIYRFTPTDLAPATTYRVRIARGLTSAADGVLKEDFTATFATILPGIESVAPDQSWTNAGPYQQVDVTFNQPMDPTAASGLSVRRADGDVLVGGKVTWNTKFTVLSWNPADRLAPQTRYAITVAKGLRGARGGVTAAERSVTFTTIALPSISQTGPRDGDTNAQRFGLNMQFSTPMDPASLEDKLSISGFTAEDLKGRITTNETFLSANLSLKPSTRYTVALAPGATDRYGQAMGGYRFAFTTGALPSSVILAVPGNGSTATYASTGDQRVYFQATNMPSAGFTLYPLTPDEGRRLLHDPQQLFGPTKFTPSQAALRTWTEKIEGTKDETLLGSTSISGGDPLAKGYYYLHTSGDLRSQFAFAVVDTVLVTKLSFDELVAWAMDHDTGKPLSGALVRVSGPGITPSEARTDANGLASFKVPAPTLSACCSDRSYIAWVDDGGRSAFTSTRWQNGVSPYQFGVPSEYYQREWVGHLYTDRPIYRPGERVEFKGIIRADDDAAYSLPSRTAPFEILINNPRGQQISRETVTLNDFGSFAGGLDIPGDAPLGDYSLSIQLKIGNNTSYIAGNSFLLAEFRTPEFQVAVTTPQTSYVNGDTIDASSAATFFFGGGLEGAPVEWTALADPSYTMTVKDFEQYSFVDFDYARQAVSADALRAKGATKTGAGGVATFTVPATLKASEGPQRFTLSATVTDENGQGGAGSAIVTVHPASYYVGLHPAQYVAREGLNTSVDLVTVDTEGRIVGGRAVTVSVYDREWITVKEEIPGGGRRYRSDVKDALVTTLRATTDANGKGSVTFKPTKPGTLRVVGEVTDGRGRVERSSTYLWVSGSGFATWQVTNDDTIKLIADKTRYQVGETAEILVPAPFAGATALVTVERGKLMTREVRHLATNSERLSIPITDRAVPDVFVSVVLYRAPTREDPSPRFKVGYVELPVSTDTRALKVQISPDKPTTKPGDTVRYGIRVTDHSGKGVKAEVSVSVVDKAVLALQDERGPDGLKAFWFERGLGVNTASSMTTSVDRWNDAVVEAARAGKGGSGLTLDRARQEFRNTAYWSAQVTTKDDGTATVDVKMPDNLTTWRMQVRAMAGDAMVGEGTNELVSAQPLMVRSALPRFLRVGDNADLRVLVRNSTKAATNVSVVLKADGVSVSGGLARTASVGPEQSAILSWPATVQDEGTATLTFTATGTGGLSDTLTQQLPVYIDMTPETMATGGVVTTEGALEAIYLPPFADTAHGSLNVQVRSALVGSMSDELLALAPTTWEGAERIASRLIATIGVRRAEKTAGVATGARDGAITSDLAALVGRQRPDGGWAWCDPLCQTDPNVTGWALLALGEAQRDGLSVDSGVVGRASSFVASYVNRPSDIAHPADNSQKAFMLAALSSAGGGSSALTPARALFEQQRAKLTNWGRSYLLLALTDAGVKPDDLQVRALLDDLASATIPSANGNHWEDGPVSGSFVTTTGTTGLGTLALARVRPDHLLLPQTVRWLVLARGADGWHTSIDRALGVLALTTYAVGTGELGGEYSYKVLLDDSEVLAGLVHRTGAATAAGKELSLASFTPGRSSLIAFTRDYGKPGRLYYTLDLRYVTPAKEIEAVNRGFAVSHEYTPIDDPAKRVTSVKVGDTVRVKVTIIAPADRNYVVIEDLLPAGLEAVDARLKNVDPALKEKLEVERAQASQQQPGAYMAPWFRWYYSPWQQVDLRDDRAVLQADRLPKGVYEYVYYARATTPGSFFVAPAHAEESYFPEVFGRSDSSRFTVAP